MAEHLPAKHTAVGLIPSAIREKKRLHGGVIPTIKTYTSVSTSISKQETDVFESFESKGYKRIQNGLAVWMAQSPDSRA